MRYVEISLDKLITTNPNLEISKIERLTKFSPQEIKKLQPKIFGKQDIRGNIYILDGNSRIEALRMKGERSTFVELSDSILTPSDLERLSEFISPRTV